MLGVLSDSRGSCPGDLVRGDLVWEILSGRSCLGESRLRDLVRGTCPGGPFQGILSGGSLPRDMKAGDIARGILQ